MKWLVILLLAANGLVWLAGDFWAPDPLSVVAVNQPLPRVSSLKVGSAPKVTPAAASTPTEPVTDPRTDTSDGAAETAPKDSVGSRCFRLGWFETAEGARAAYRALGSPGDVYAVREQDRALEPLHWVIIPPQPEGRAQRLFDDLQRRGIDSYLVSQGENRNAISLGLFQSEDAAKRVLDAKKRQNLNAILANFPRNQLSYVLVFEVAQADGDNAGDGAVREYRGDFEMVEISRCEGIATTPENP